MRLFAATVFAFLIFGAQSSEIVKVPVYEYGDGSYVVRAGIGSPPQNFTLLLDFRDIVLWVPGKNCGSTIAKDCPAHCTDPVFCKWICKASCCDRKFLASADGGQDTCDGLKQFDPSLSSSYKWTSEKLDTIGTYPFLRWPLPYPAAAGNVSSDTFQIGDLTVERAFIGMALKVDLPPTFDFGYDGVLGLSNWNSEWYEGESFLLTASAYGLIPGNVFTLWLRDAGPNPDMAPAGQLTLGGTDAEHCGRPKWFMFHTEDYPYALAMTSFSFGERNFSGALENWELSIESYPFVFGAPKDVLDGIAREAGATASEDGYRIACDAKLPTLVLSLIVGPEEVYDPVIDTISIPGDALIKRTGTLQSECSLNVFAVVGNDTYTEAMFFIGAPVARFLCETMDVDNNRAGFAPLLPKN